MEIAYRLNPTVDNAELDGLYAAAWPNHGSPWDFAPEIVHLFAFVGASVDDDFGPALTRASECRRQPYTRASG